MQEKGSRNILYNIMCILYYNELRMTRNYKIPSFFIFYRILFPFLLLLLSIDDFENIVSTC